APMHALSLGGRCEAMGIHKDAGRLHFLDEPTHALHERGAGNPVTDGRLVDPDHREIAWHVRSSSFLVCRCRWTCPRFYMDVERDGPESTTPIQKKPCRVCLVIVRAGGDRMWTRGAQALREAAAERTCRFATWQDKVRTLAERLATE